MCSYDTSAEVSKGTEEELTRTAEVASRAVGRAALDAVHTKKHNNKVDTPESARHSVATDISNTDINTTMNTGADIAIPIINAASGAAGESAVDKIPIEDIKANLYCALINAKDNEELLKHIPHEKFEDLALIAKCRIGENASLTVSNSLASRFRMTSDEIMDMAAANMTKEKFVCKSLSSMLQEMMPAAIMTENFKEELFPSQSPPAYVLTNELKHDGAAAITSKEALEEAEKTVGGDFYILPSSRHEVILVPESMCASPEDVKNLEAMVRNVNATQVDDKDRLSDHIYHYSSKAKKVSMVDSRTLGKTADNSILKLADELKHSRRR